MYKSEHDNAIPTKANLNGTYVKTWPVGPGTVAYDINGVELIVVVVIIGILIAIAVPVYTKTPERARESACHTNQKIINQASYHWHLKSSTVSNPYADDVQILVDDGYLQSVPECSGHDFTTIDSNGNTQCPDSGRHTLP
jgi:competence protein ComGC